MTKSIAIIGAGGHGKVVGEIAELCQFNVIDFYDDEFIKENKFQYPILGTTKELENKFKNYNFFFVAIGDNHFRYEKIEWLKSFNLEITNLIHPSSVVSKYSSLGKGICIMANAVINPGTNVGDGVIINTASSIDHDCIIEDFVHISPGSKLSGSVKVGKFTHIGTGSSIHPGINIGKNVKMGIGSRVYKDVVDSKIYIE